MASKDNKEKQNIQPKLVRFVENRCLSPAQTHTTSTGDVWWGGAGQAGVHVAELYKSENISGIRKGKRLNVFSVFRKNF